MSGSTSPPGLVVLGSSVALSDGVVPAQKATVAIFHSADNQSPGGTAYGLLTGGVAQLLNPNGAIDRQRETGFDNISASGVATGTQQLAGPLLTTNTTSGAIVGSAVAQSVTLAATVFQNRGVTGAFVGGTTIWVDSGTAASEYVYLNSVNTVTNVVNGTFRNNHAAGVSAAAFSFNQARDATIPDGSTPAGVGAGAAYLFNAAGTGTVEFERSFSGELMGAKGTGAAVAAEYEDTSGGPVLASGVVSGFRLLPAQALLGVGTGTGPITATTVGATSIVFATAAATNTIPAGHAIQLVGGALLEVVFVSVNWVPGSSVTVPLQSPVVNAGQVTANWGVFAPNGPGLNGFLAHGIGIEEEALYNPVDGKYYVERSATQDNVPPANVVMESGTLWNGTGMDRMRGATADGLPITGIAAEAAMLWNGTTFDRFPGSAATGAKFVPGTIVYVAPAVASIAVGGTAVVALAAGTIKTGFDIKNPANATEALFFNLVGVAGVVESGSTFALAAGASYHGTAGTGQALSVNAATTGHAFAAMGY